MTTPTIPPLHGTVTVSVPLEHAFRIFTDSIHTWWPAQYHIGQAETARRSATRSSAVAAGPPCWNCSPRRQPTSSDAVRYLSPTRPTCR